MTIAYCTYIYSRLQSESSTGSVSSQRVRLNLTITVESVDFDPNVGLLRINGKVASENQYVKVLFYKFSIKNYNVYLMHFYGRWAVIIQLI